VELKNNHICNISLGEVIIELECPTPEYAAELRKYLNSKAVFINPTINLKLKIINYNDTPALPNSLFTNKHVQLGGFGISEGLVHGCFDPEKKRGEIYVNEILLKGAAKRIFEQLVYQAFYTAGKIKNYDALLVHSSGIIHDGSGFLFVGSSGAGKSTIAKLSKSKDRVILNDEIVLVGFKNDSVYICNTPFNGYFLDKSEGKAPLSAIFLISHGKIHRISKISMSEAVVILMQEIVPPMGLEEELNYKTRLQMLEAADRLRKKVPIRSLQFAPDEGFWQEINREFQRKKETEND
jgi:hypothetical protein